MVDIHESLHLGTNEHRRRLSGVSTGPMGKKKCYCIMYILINHKNFAVKIMVTTWSWI